jgi:hypothetical protein
MALHTVVAPENHEKEKREKEKPKKKTGTRIYLMLLSP